MTSLIWVLAGFSPWALCFLWCLVVEVRVDVRRLARENQRNIDNLGCMGIKKEWRTLWYVNRRGPLISVWHNPHESAEL